MTEEEKQTKYVDITTFCFFKYAYYAMLKKNAKKYNISAKEQSDLVYEVCLIVCIQVLFVVGLFLYNRPSADAGDEKYTYQALYNLMLLASALTVHFFTLPQVNSGMVMQRVAITHPEKFTHPRTAFYIGFILYADMILLESLNLIMTLSYNDPSTLLTSYISFRINQQIPEMYYYSL